MRAIWLAMCLLVGVVEAGCGGDCGCPEPCMCEVGHGCGCERNLRICEDPNCDCVPFFNPYADRGDYDCGWYVWGDWLPDAPTLFRQFAADPRQVTYSVGWRFDDDALAQNTIPVSFGNYWGLYRWHCAWPYGGDMEIGIEGAVWAVFEPLEESSPLIDADYYVGVPIVYAFDNWQFRLRGYHISTHLGDEFLLNNPGFDRRNPSAEYLDFYGSYYFGEQIRIYAGLGYIIQQDKSFRWKRFFQGFGMEVRPYSLGYYDCRQRLLGHPIFAAHIRGTRDHKNHIDQTYILGYEWIKLTGLEKATRIFLEYHDGYSVDGQFCRTPTTWFSVRLSYGY
ncbi:MAG: DUF1207 domain-containing protein [Chlamydiia bacterium]|nr:DUF1207 domain-containing protein [Chlamydiia bacterium]